MWYWINPYSPPWDSKRIEVRDASTIEVHHIIPISLEWEHSQKNKVPINKDEHKLIHNTLNIPYGIIRRYREKTNWILIPNKYSLWEKLDLWNIYFSNISALPPSLRNLQIKKLRQFDWNNWLEDNIPQILTNIIENQYERVQSILNSANACEPH